ncbi:MAG: X-Pro dipeptidyl-peptidase family protein [Solirubrobacterales bacterium]|nr:X-Pro dipeptidyl-peptidase family protein [Solirubrobacterales bacterium]
MKKISFAVLLAAAGLSVAPGLASASGVDYADGVWTEASIPEPDGTVLHADVLRPKGLTDADKTPVIISIGPYFNHSGQTGPAGPAENAAYDPVGPNAGPSERFQDFVEGAKLFTRDKKYTFVMVDLRGFGGSTGCLDWGGPGEQSDVVETVKWAASQPWSTGAVGTYGKSYDGMTGLMAAAARPEGLKAVVAQEPVYDNYRYLYGNGIRRENALATPALYDAIAATPGPVLDTTNPTYNVSANMQDAQRPGCFAGNFADQAGNDDHTDAYWTKRNIIENVKGSNVPVFITQGMTENNTAPDGVAEFLTNHTGPERGWLGPWNHVRGAEMDGSKLAMGRKGFYDEVMRWYDKYLYGIEPAIQDPPFAIQSVTTGKWRPEAEWPPSDAVRTTVTQLKAGTYTDDAQGTKNTNDGIWTVSKPLPYDVHLAGAGQVTVNVSSTLPRANLVVDLYDLDATGKGPLVAKQGSLIRASGPITLDLMSADWKFAKGHRIGIRVVSNNFDWWIAAIPTQQDVTVSGGSATLPFLTYSRPQLIQGDSGTTRGTWLASTSTAPADAVAGAVDFTLPPALAAQPAEMKAQLDSYK